MYTFPPLRRTTFRCVVPSPRNIWKTHSSLGDPVVASTHSFDVLPTKGTRCVRRSGCECMACEEPPARSGLNAAPLFPDQSQETSKRVGCDSNRSHVTDTIAETRRPTRLGLRKRPQSHHMLSSAADEALVARISSSKNHRDRRSGTGPIAANE